MRSFFRSLTGKRARGGDSGDDSDAEFPTFNVTIPDADRDPGYPIGVPSKFDPEGNVQPFSGNTIIVHLSPRTEFYASLLELHAKLAASPLSSLFALLPPESWHMTIFGTSNSSSLSTLQLTPPRRRMRQRARTGSLAEGSPS
jgi:hypothetical protein